MSTSKQDAHLLRHGSDEHVDGWFLNGRAEKVYGGFLPGHASVTAERENVELFYAGTVWGRDYFAEFVDAPITAGTYGLFGGKKAVVYTHEVEMEPYEVAEARRVLARVDEAAELRRTPLSYIAGGKS